MVTVSGGGVESSIPNSYSMKSREARVKRGDTYHAAAAQPGRPRKTKVCPTGSCALCYAPAAEVRLDWKHSLQKTGRPWVGRNGTVVSRPHCEHAVCVSVRA